jgi:hypothetical protein
LVGYCDLGLKFLSRELNKGNPLIEKGIFRLLFLTQIRFNNGYGMQGEKQWFGNY